MYVDSAAIAMPSTETVSVGIQNKNTLKILFPSRLAPKRQYKEQKRESPEERRKGTPCESTRDEGQARCLLLTNPFEN